MADEWPKIGMLTPGFAKLPSSATIVLTEDGDCTITEHNTLQDPISVWLSREETMNLVVYLTDNLGIKCSSV